MSVNFTEKRKVFRRMPCRGPGPRSAAEFERGQSAGPLVELQRRAAQGLDSVVIRAGDFFGSGTGTWIDLAVEEQRLCDSRDLDTGLEAPCLALEPRHGGRSRRRRWISDCARRWHQQQGDKEKAKNWRDATRH